MQRYPISKAKRHGDSAVLYDAGVGGRSSDGFGVHSVYLISVVPPHPNLARMTTAGRLHKIPKIPGCVRARDRAQGMMLGSPASI